MGSSLREIGAKSYRGHRPQKLYKAIEIAETITESLTIVASSASDLEHQRWIRDVIIIYI